jgi:hypothetical protein
MTGRSLVSILTSNESGQWPTGEIDGHNPEYDFAETRWPTEPGAFSFAIDPSPSKQFLRLNRRASDIKPFADLSFPHWPKEELYDLRNDPDQLQNVAKIPDYVSNLKALRHRLATELKAPNDPRVAPH